MIAELTEFMVETEAETALQANEAATDFDMEAWQAMLAELTDILSTADKSDEQPDEVFGNDAASYDSSTSTATDTSASGTNGASTSSGTTSGGEISSDVPSPIFDDRDAGAALQDKLPGDFDVASTSALSGASSPDFGGQQVFDWSTNTAPGQSLSAGDVAHMDANYFTANQAIANDDDSFTVIPSTSGHDGLHADFGMDPSREAVLSFTAEFGEGTDFVKGGKLMGLNIGEGAMGGESDPNGGSVRLMFREEGRLEVYSYHQDQKSVYGDSTESSFFAKPGESFDVDLKVRANDAGQANGGFDLFINGELVASQDNMRFTQDGGDINSVLAHIFWGGQGADWEAKAGSSVTIDDLEAFKLR